MNCIFSIGVDVAVYSCEKYTRILYSILFSIRFYELFENNGSSDFEDRCRMTAACPIMDNRSDSIVFATNKITKTRVATASMPTTFPCFETFLGLQAFNCTSNIEQATKTTPNNVLASKYKL